jgi:hypothetical protein
MTYPHDGVGHVFAVEIRIERRIFDRIAPRLIS